VRHQNNRHGLDFPRHHGLPLSKADDADRIIAIVRAFAKHPAMDGMFGPMSGTGSGRQPRLPPIADNYMFVFRASCGRSAASEESNPESVSAKTTRKLHSDICHSGFRRGGAAPAPE